MRDKIYEIEGLPNRLKTWKRVFRMQNYSSYLSFIISHCSQHLKNHNRDKVYLRNGTNYGYPKCCIKEFCSQSPNDRTDNQKKSMSDGFVPCRKCADKIISGKVTLDMLIRKRKHKLPFPKGY